MIHPNLVTITNMLIVMAKLSYTKYLVIINFIMTEDYGEINRMQNEYCMCKKFTLMHTGTFFMLPCTDSTKRLFPFCSQMLLAATKRHFVQALNHMHFNVVAGKKQKNHTIYINSS